MRRLRSFIIHFLHWCHPPCFRRTWRTAAVLRSPQAAGVALCYGNNNGGACAAGSVHPLAPNVAQSSPRVFSCSAGLSNKPSLPSRSIHSLAVRVSPSQAWVSPHNSLIFFSVSPTFCAYTHASCLFLLQSLLSISSFLLPHKDSHSPTALRGEQNVLWKCKPCTEMPSQSGFLS